ncbi:MAG: LLM class flavin-dependent oxidoreductase [Actinobacteria bacterium]|nr:MAG: LLM class flavin-dependent oxidoreductase [Actinomycetota bacterium]
MNDKITIDLQVNQGQCSWAQLTEIAHIAENNNYQTLWVADHLSGQVMNAPSMPECFTLLGALAAITSTINIGPLVANVGNRHPGVLASAAATVQNISGGRLVLGLGAGASPTSKFAAEQLALGIALPVTMGERHARLERTLDVLEEIWSPTRDKKFATFEMPCKLPPRILGVNSTALAKIAGMRTDGVNIRSSHPQRAQILRVAQGAAATTGKTNFVVSVWDWFDEALLDAQSPVRQQLESEGVNRIILLMRGVPDAKRLAIKR